MKLAAHYNRVNIIATLSVLFFGAIIYYFAINQIAAKLLDDHLSEEVSEVLGYIDANQRLPKEADFDEDQTRFYKVNGKPLPTRFYDTVYTKTKLISNRSGRAVEGSVLFKGETYRFTIIISKEGTENFVQIIAMITLALMLGLFMILFLTNRYLLNGLWQPFYKTLGQLKAFDIEAPAKFLAGNTKVDEFKELDNAVYIMTNRVKSDYQNLKQFTENASHEMMTPLSVITAKLDTLIQDETLQQEQFEQITDIYSAAGKLARLSQSLLLLVKIENDQIADIERLNMEQLVNEKLKQFQELFASKVIIINVSLANKEVQASRYLVDILLNNLFSNAVRHNVNGGRLNIYLNSGQLIFQNQGTATALDGEKIFDRFQKGNSSEGVGLGLTIVKNICHSYGWKLAYKYTDGLHTFIIQF